MYLRCLLDLILVTRLSQSRILLSRDVTPNFDPASLHSEVPFGDENLAGVRPAAENTGLLTHPSSQNRVLFAK